MTEITINKFRVIGFTNRETHFAALIYFEHENKMNFGTIDYESFNPKLKSGEIYESRLTGTQDEFGNYKFTIPFEPIKIETINDEKLFDSFDEISLDDINEDDFTTLHMKLDENLQAIHPMKIANLDINRNKVYRMKLKFYGDVTYTIVGKNESYEMLCGFLKSETDSDIITKIKFDYDFFNNLNVDRGSYAECLVFVHSIRTTEYKNMIQKEIILHGLNAKPIDNDYRYSDFKINELKF